ncbi:MAG TPA: zf-HC2 domain-containing protein [Propionicimonas sp.]|uniref:zf-HC2 domain-containing protein n=1 Tax=Propionicimonas sp. TaxID=1955623 RepID=UPI002F3FB393
MTDWHPEDEALLALALADIEPAEQARLIDHLATCAPCRDGYADLSDGLAQALAASPAIAPPPGFSGRVVAAMGPAAGARVRPPRGRLLLVAAAVLIGLLSGIGGTLAVVGGLSRSAGSGSDHAPVATQLLTATGEAVGSAGITMSRGQTFVLLNITTGKPGMSYECFLVGRDGTRTSGGKWALTSDYGAVQASGSWLVPVTGDAPVGVELVAPSGKVWSTGHF